MSLNIQKAIIFAALKHEGQKRKGTEIPYIVHPMEVMQILTAIGCREGVVIAGILHDTLEDTDATPEEIKELFGADVLSIVQGESEDKSKTWKERKAATIEHLKTSAGVESKIVCFADKLSNIRSMLRDKHEIGSELWKRFNASRENIEWYYRGISEALKKIPVNGYCDTIKSRIFFIEFEETINAVFSD